MFKYKWIIQKTTLPKCRRPFPFASKCLSVLCIYISDTISWFQRPNTKLEQGLRPVNKVTNNSCLLYYFTLLFFSSIMQDRRLSSVAKIFLDNKIKLIILFCQFRCILVNCFILLNSAFYVAIKALQLRGSKC